MGAAMTDVNPAHSLGAVDTFVSFDIWGYFRPGKHIKNRAARVVRDVFRPTAFSALPNLW